MRISDWSSDVCSSDLGAQAFVYSAEEPGQLRGPEHHLAWCDELANWAHATEAWDNLQLGLRLGTQPRVMVTTTPRPVRLLKAMRPDQSAAVTRGRTRDNTDYLTRSFLAHVHLSLSRWPPGSLKRLET